MAEPLLADVINPKLALRRRLDAEGQAEPYLPDQPASAPTIRGTKPFTPEERLRQRMLLEQFLRQRDAARQQP